MSWTSCCKLTVWIRESGRILWEQRVEERCSSGVQLGVGQGCGLQKKKAIKNICHIVEVLFWACGSALDPVGSTCSVWQQTWPLDTEVRNAVIAAHCYNIMKPSLLKCTWSD